MRLTPFDGDSAKWPEIITGFKALVHDVVPSEYQRMALLKQHLGPAVSASLALQLNDPNQYLGAPRSLRTWYGNPKLVAKAHIEALKRLPFVKPGDLNSLEQLGAALADALNNLAKAGLYNTIKSESELEGGLSKKPTDLHESWGKKMRKIGGYPNLLDFQAWLTQKYLIGRCRSPERWRSTLNREPNALSLLGRQEIKGYQSILLT